MNANVPAKGFLVYWFDHNDLSANQANFKLDCDGGELTLSNPKGEKVARVNFPHQFQNVSYARLTDGATAWSFCTTPTPGTSNDLASYALERCPEPEFSVKGGVYKTPVTVRISCPPGMKIRYTTDGSEPHENSLSCHGTGTNSLPKPSFCAPV